MGIIGHSIAMRLAAGQRRKGDSQQKSTGIVGGMLARVVGDPDGSKARAAGARGRSTKPLDPIDQAWNYVEQNGTNWHTPKQRRRLEKKLRRHGLLAKRSGGKISKTLTGLATRRAVLDEVTA